MYAVKIPAFGTPTVVGFPDKDRPTAQYEAMSSAVGGFIEHVHVSCGDKPLDMWVNEEGLLQRLPYNSFATHLYQHTAGTTEVLIVGDALITAGTMDGDTLPLTQEQVDAVMVEASAWAEAHDVDLP